MKGKFIKCAASSLFLVLPLLFADSALPDVGRNPETPISASYIKLNSDGTETQCIVTGNETKEEREYLQKTGCTLETLRNNSDIEVKVTIRTSDGLFRSFLLSAKYYLMWLNSGIHALNVIHTLPLAVYSLVTLHPADSLIYLIYSVLYNVGFSRNANQTIYPFLEKILTSYFYPEGLNKKGNDGFGTANNQFAEIENVGVWSHFLIISSDLIIWGLDWPFKGYIKYGDYNINKLMLGLDLLHLVLDMTI